MTQAFGHVFVVSTVRKYLVLDEITLILAMLLEGSPRKHSQSKLVLV
jgi:hypothetical protein